MRECTVAINLITNRLKTSDSKARILQRTNKREQSLVEKMIMKTAPKVHTLISETNFQSKKNKFLRDRQNFEDMRAQSIKEKKFIQEKQISKRKSQVLNYKHRYTQQIRRQSIANNMKLRSLRQKFAEQKRKKQELMKESQNMSRETIRIFHQTKKQQLRKKRQLQHEENQQRILKFAKVVARKQNENDHFMDTTVYENKKYSKNLKEILNKVYSMRSHQFKSLNRKYQFNLENEQPKIEQLEKIINVMDQNKENYA